MLPQFGFAEFILLAIIALVVVGPRELPVMMRRAGQALRKVRQVGREFQRSFDEIGRQTELEELKREVQALRRLEPLSDVRAPLDDLGRELRAVEPPPSAATIHDPNAALSGDGESAGAGTGQAATDSDDRAHGAAVAEPAAGGDEDRR